MFSSSPRVSTCIFAENEAYASSGAGGYTGTGNINADPNFVNAGNGNYR